MRPPQLESGPTVDETVRGRLTFGGSLVGLLFDSHPPIAYDLRWEQAYQLIPSMRHMLTYRLHWREKVTNSWHAGEPMVGGEMITQVTLDIENVPSGRSIRLIYPTGLHDRLARTVLVWP